jgi:hypothetical protein
MPCVRFEPTIPEYERTKRVRALDRAATVIGTGNKFMNEFPTLVTEYP